MAKVLPGGQIIGGMGGRIYTGTFGLDHTAFKGKEGSAPKPAEFNYIDVKHWQIQREWLNAECTHSGTWGAISRRNVAHDWMFSAAAPYDQAIPPELVCTYTARACDTLSINCAIAFYLGDKVINPEAAFMGMEQKFYFSPAAIIRRSQPVLSADGDVIRINVSGEGNGRLFLIPDEEDECKKYIAYLNARKWL